MTNFIILEYYNFLIGQELVYNQTLAQNLIANGSVVDAVITQQAQVNKFSSY